MSAHDQRGGTNQTQWTPAWHPTKRLKLPPIIGFGHRKRVGKDTASFLLLEAIDQQQGNVDNVRKCAFADKLKEISHDLYSWAGLNAADWYEIPGNEHFRDVVLPEIGKTPRQIWIDIGTPAIRKAVYDGTWVEFVLRSRQPFETLVISDVRFPNEIERIRQVGGICIKVERPQVPPTRDVADDALAEFTGWDWTIVNDGTLDDLRAKVAELLRQITSCA